MIANITKVPLIKLICTSKNQTLLDVHIFMVKKATSFKWYLYGIALCQKMLDSLCDMCYNAIEAMKTFTEEE